MDCCPILLPPWVYDEAVAQGIFSADNPHYERHDALASAPDLPRLPEKEAVTGQKNGVADGTRTHAGPPPVVPRMSPHEGEAP